MNDTNAVSCEGGCACGDVRFRANNRPRRTGLCHCMTCRKAHGATFSPEYEVWVIRREAWQPPLAIPQFAQDRQP